MKLSSVIQNPAHFPAHSGRCSNHSLNGETVVLLLPDFFSLKRNKDKEKKQHTHFKIPPKKPAVSLIIMEENLDGDVSARQGKEPIALNET